MTILPFLLAAAPAGQIHLQIDGEGYFRFGRGTQAVYSSDAVLTTRSGMLATTEGYPILPQIRVPSDGFGLKVSMDGSVTVNGKMAGRIVLAAFSGGQLEKIGAYLTSGSRSTIGYPGEGVFGIIRTISGTVAKAAAAPAAPSHPVKESTTIEIALSSEVEGSSILLGDIAQISAPKDTRDAIAAVDLGTTPIYGAKRGISRTYVAARLRVIGLDPDTMDIECPVGASVTRKGQKVDPDAMIAAAAAGVKSQLGIDEPMRIDRDLPDIWIPTGDVQYVARQVVQNGDNASVNVEIDVDGKEVARRTIGLVPTTPAVRLNPGDPVKICLVKNGAKVEVSGKLRSGGKVGGIVTVVNEEGAVFTGILRTTSLVEVKL